MSSLGRYNLLISDTGQYAVEWFEHRTRQLVILPDFIEKIDEMVDKELSARRHFAEIFNSIFGENGDDFAKHPDFVIMDYISHEETTPNKKLGKEETFQFNIKCLLLAYNRWKGTNLKFRDVEKMCNK